jgi:CBS domain-containing protein
LEVQREPFRDVINGRLAGRPQAPNLPEGGLPLSAGGAGGSVVSPARSLPMRIREILLEKGTNVVSMWPEHTVADAIARCDERNISAVVITDHNGAAIGLVSDRDALRALARRGTRALTLRVTEIMKTPPPTCHPDDSVTDILGRMTYERIRHVVVIDGGRMAGVVSIGDLVKSKLRDADLESRVLRERNLSRLAAEGNEA